MEKTKAEELSPKQISRQNKIQTRPIRLTPGGYKISTELIKPQSTYTPSSARPYIQKRLGWLPDVPDFRDYSIKTNKLSAKEKSMGKTRTISEMVVKANIGSKKKIPATVDLRNWFSEIEDQGNLGSCTAHAGVSLYEYFENRAFGKYIDGSHLFLYKATRNLMHETGDTGAYLRSTMGAMALFGIPPEEYWPYDIDNFDEEPTSFCYAYGQNYQAISYCRLDQNGMTPQEILDNIKRFTAAGLPAMFGFTVYSTIYDAESTGKIPFPTQNDSIIGGHAVVIAGYDDNMKLPNALTKGAFIIRNSWGTSFGADGYCFLPYDYVLQGIADDFWVMMKGDWIDTQHFQI